MKKIFFVVFLLCLSLTIHAQIQRNFWGLELGRSTKTDVINLLSSNGLEYNQNLEGLDVISINDDVLSFGGYSWGGGFLFYHNILFRVTLMRIHLGFSSSGESYEIDTKYIFNDLKSKLNKKYNNLENPLIGQSQNHYVRRDNQTVIEMILDSEGNLILDYYDRKLAKASTEGYDL